MEKDGKRICDIHAASNYAKPALYDARLKDGRWADLCQACFNANGCTLGLGKGSKL